MTRQILWTPEANVKFQSIYDYLKEIWSHKIAEQFYENTLATIELISNFPGIGNSINEKGDIHTFVLSKHNKIFYRVTEDNIIVLTLFDNRQNPKKQV